MFTGKKNIPIFFLGLLFSFLLAMDARGGNRSLIEKRLQELDTLNKEAVEQATEIPEQGVIQTTIEIPSGSNIKKLKVKKLKITTLSARTPYTIKVGADDQKDKALALADQLRNLGYPAFVSTPFDQDGSPQWLVFIGSYPTEEAAQRANNELPEQMFSTSVVTFMPYTIRIGGDVTESEATKLEEKLSASGYMPYRVRSADENMFHVLLGAFKTRRDGLDALGKLKGIEAATMVVTR